MLIVKAIKLSRYHGVSNAKIDLINEKICIFLQANVLLGFYYS